MARERILLVDNDLHNLSRIYLALIHRNYKVEACDKGDDIRVRIKRFKPVVVILNSDNYNTIRDRLKIPAIVLVEKTETVQLNDGDMQLKKPVQVNILVRTVEKLV
jgi:DNA-binding response OmpR family regulator